MDTATARSDIRNRYMDLTPEKFEQLCKIVTEQVEGPAYIQLTPFQGDRGLDIRGDVGHEFVDAQFGAQVKQYTRNIGEPSIRTFVGALGINNCQTGCYITSSRFIDSASKAAANADIPITLVDGDDLVDIMISYQLGITGSNNQYEMDTEFWNIFDETTGDDLIPSNEIPQANSIDVFQTVMQGIDQGYRYNPEIRDYMETHTSRSWKRRQADYYATHGWCLKYIHRDTTGEYRGEPMRRWGLTRDGQEYIRLLNDNREKQSQQHLIDHIRNMEITKRILPKIREEGAISNQKYKDFFFEEVALNRETSDRRAGAIGQWLRLLPEVRKRGSGGNLEYEYIGTTLKDY